MKKITFLGFVLSLYFGVYGQDMNQILTKYFSLQGGERKLQSVHSLLIDVSLTTSLGEIPAKIYIKENAGYKLVMDIKGQKNYDIVNRNGWFAFIQYKNIKENMSIESETYRLVFNNIKIFDLLTYQLPEQRSHFEFGGKVDIDGQSCYLITYRTDNPEFFTQYYIDEFSYNLVKETMNYTSPDSGQKELTTQYANFSKVEGGFVFPMTIKMAIGEAKVKSYKINPKIEDKEFEMESLKK